MHKNNMTASLNTQVRDFEWQVRLDLKSETVQFLFASDNKHTQ